MNDSSNKKLLNPLVYCYIGYKCHMLFPISSWNGSLYFLIRSLVPISQTLQLSQIKIFAKTIFSDTSINTITPAIIIGYVMYEHSYNARYATKSTVRYATNTICCDYNSVLNVCRTLDPPFAKYKISNIKLTDINTIKNGINHILNYNKLIDKNKYKPNCCKIFIHPNKNECFESYFEYLFQRLFDCIKFYIKLFGIFTLISKLISKPKVFNWNFNKDIKPMIKNIIKLSIRSSLLFTFLFHNGYYFFCIITNLGLNAIKIETKLIYFLWCYIHGYFLLKIQGSINRIHGIALFGASKIAEMQINKYYDIDFVDKYDKNHVLNRKNYLPSLLFGLLMAIYGTFIDVNNKHAAKGIEFRILQKIFQSFKLK